MSSRFKKNIAHHYYQKALTLQDDDEGHQILIFLNSATRLNPRKILYWEALFNVAIELEQYVVALKSINHLSRFEKYSSPQVQLIKSKILFSMGEFRKSMKVLSKIKECPTMLSQIFFCKAKCLLHMGRYQKALSLFKQIAHDHQSFPSSQFFKGICYFFLEKYRIAIRFFNEAAYHDEYRFNPDLLLFKGNCHYNLEQFQRALINYEEVLAVEPSYAETNFAILLARYRILSPK